MPQMSSSMWLLLFLVYLLYTHHMGTLISYLVTPKPSNSFVHPLSNSLKQTWEW